MVDLDDGSSVVLGITSAATGLPGIRRRLLSPLGCTGGWVATDTLSGPAMATLAPLLCRGELVWRVGPSDDLIPDAALPGFRDELTHVIDLREGADAARASWSGSARRGVGRAERAGVTIRIGVTSEDWDAYRRLYGRTRDRWDTPLNEHDDSLFGLISKIGGDEALLVLAERAGEACAGAVMFLHGRHASGWHAASDVASASGSFNALQWTVLDILEKRGIDTYDLLGSSGLEGVVKFKLSIGGFPHRVRTVVGTHFLVAAARSARRLVVPNARARQVQA